MKKVAIGLVVTTLASLAVAGPSAYAFPEARACVNTEDWTFDPPLRILPLSTFDIVEEYSTICERAAVTSFNPPGATVQPEIYSGRLEFEGTGNCAFLSFSGASFLLGGTVGLISQISHAPLASPKVIVPNAVCNESSASGAAVVAWADPLT